MMCISQWSGGCVCSTSCTLYFLWCFAVHEVIVLVLDVANMVLVVDVDFMSTLALVNMTLVLLESVILVKATVIVVVKASVNVSLIVNVNLIVIVIVIKMVIVPVVVVVTSTVAVVVVVSRLVLCRNSFLFSSVLYSLLKYWIRFPCKADCCLVKLCSRAFCLETANKVKRIVEMYIFGKLCLSCWFSVLSGLKKTSILCSSGVWTSRETGTMTDNRFSGSCGFFQRVGDDGRPKANGCVFQLVTVQHFLFRCLLVKRVVLDARPWLTFNFRRLEVLQRRCVCGLGLLIFFLLLSILLLQYCFAANISVNVTLSSQAAA